MVIVTNKATGSSSTVAGNNIILSSPSVVKLSLSPAQLQITRRSAMISSFAFTMAKQSELFIFMLIIRMAMIMI